MATNEILVEVSDRIATVTLNRPEKLNALSRSVLVELGSVFTELRSRDDVGVVILTGAGPKAFAAGADIQELSELSPVDALEHSRLGQSVFNQIEGLGKTVIAAVNGFALGGGCELAMAATIRLASDRASFGQPEVNLGLIPGFAGTQRLARLVGKSRAAELILTGRRIKAEEAERIGLVSRVVETDALAEAARSLASEILGKAPLAVSYALDAIHRGLDMTFEDGSRLEASLFGLLFSTADMKEGTGAFLEKRTPEFKGE